MRIYAAILLLMTWLPCQARPLEQTVSESSLIVIARMPEVILTPAPAGNFQPLPGGGVAGHGGVPPELVGHIGVWSVVNTLKGEAPATLQFQIPPIDIINNYGDPNFRLNGKRLYLICLSARGRGGALVPTDSQTPVIPLADDLELPTTRPSTAPASAMFNLVVRLMLASLKDPQTRVADLYLLRTVNSKAVVEAARAALDDPDIEMQKNALCCLAENQYPEAIPRIAKIVHSADGRGVARVVEALRDYETPEATPYLNELLVDPQSAALRQFSAMTLSQNQLADQSSIPYLLASFKDPATQGLTAFYVDVMLHRLIPSLGEHSDRNISQQHRDADIQAVEKWLSDPQTAKP